MKIKLLETKKSNKLPEKDNLDQISNSRTLFVYSKILNKLKDLV